MPSRAPALDRMPRWRLPNVSADLRRIVYCCRTFSGRVATATTSGDRHVTTPSDAPDWRQLSRQDLDLRLNNSMAVAGSGDMVAGLERISGDMRAKHPDHLDLRYGPRERNRIDFLKVRDGAPTLVFIHGGYWQMRSKEVFTNVAAGPMAHGINVALIGYTLAP